MSFIVVALFCLISSSCGGDDDEPGTGSSKYKVSLSCQKSHLQNHLWYYKATIKVSGASAADVTTLGVRWQKEGGGAGSIREAGAATTKATCEFGGLAKGTYYVYAYANISGTQVQSEKQTIKIR